MFCLVIISVIVSEYVAGVSHCLFVDPPGLEFGCHIIV